jgi:hypothetical protein
MPRTAARSAAPARAVNGAAGPLTYAAYQSAISSYGASVVVWFMTAIYAVVEVVDARLGRRQRRHSPPSDDQVAGANRLPPPVDSME